ncbi:hypothetical protein ACJX0J_040354, partial [Zea mays]
VIFVDADQIISENEEALWFRLMSLFCLHFPTGLEKKSTISDWHNIFYLSIEVAVRSDQTLKKIIKKMEIYHLKEIYKSNIE